MTIVLPGGRYLQTASAFLVAAEKKKRINEAFSTESKRGAVWKTTPLLIIPDNEPVWF
ncbi:MAG: hypothetical protein K6A68_15165 [Clostridiales bacterium]|nr:hypothetical protein [Clostridia bacterium]MCR4884908.1 hypothetical protein [Clostridiales bacterium]